jgi:hypothetical protein
MQIIPTTIIAQEISAILGARRMKSIPGFSGIKAKNLGGLAGACHAPVLVAGAAALVALGAAAAGLADAVAFLFLVLIRTNP